MIVRAIQIASCNICLSWWIWWFFWLCCVTSCFISFSSDLYKCQRAKVKVEGEQQCIWFLAFFRLGTITAHHVLLLLLKHIKDLSSESVAYHGCGLIYLSVIFYQNCNHVIPICAYFCFPITSSINSAADMYKLTLSYDHILLILHYGAVWFSF